MERFNPWWQNKVDEKYLTWSQSRVKWIPKIMDKITTKPFSMHFLIGPRQVGKTTTLKLLIHNLIASGRDPKSIFYYPCDELVDYRELGEVLDNYIQSASAWNVTSSIIILDEISFVNEWWRAVKSRLDEGRFKNDVVVITGSATIDLLKQKERFPGRRGNGKDLVMLPMSFDEYVSIIGSLQLKKVNITELDKIDQTMKANSLFSDAISKLFREYLITGGFPLPVMDFIEHGYVKEETKRTYLDWIKGDLQKIGKSERYFKEVVRYLVGVRSSPISWISISRDTSINSPHTVESYISSMEMLFLIKTLYLLSPESKVDSKKNKKVHFSDPFIHQLMADYTRSDSYEENIVEGIAASHISRKAPVFYWRNGSEVDVVSIINNKQVGFEVKWGPMTWKKPRHLKSFLLTKETLPLFLASLDLGLTDQAVEYLPMEKRTFKKSFAPEV